MLLHCSIIRTADERLQCKRQLLSAAAEPMELLCEGSCREAFARQLAAQWEEYQELYARLDAAKRVSTRGVAGGAGGGGGGTEG